MTFIWPWALILPVLVLPLAIAAWVFGRRRQRRETLRFTEVELIGAVLPRPAGERRLLTALLLLAGLLLVLGAVSRPVAKVKVTSPEATVMLAIDVSLSMEATDFSPDRLTAASRAAGEFIDNTPPEVRIGLVTFAGTARTLIPPTRDRQQLHDALDGLEPEQGTAIGEGILTSLQSVGAAKDGRTGPSSDSPTTSILLLSDGENTVGRDPIEAAQRARQLGIPISTVAIGTPGGQITVRGTPVRVTVNEGQLRQIAEATGGEFFSASSSADLTSVYKRLSRQTARETRTVEVTAIAALLGAILIMISAGLSLFWVRNFP